MRQSVGSSFASWASHVGRAPVVAAASIAWWPALVLMAWMLAAPPGAAAADGWLSSDGEVAVRHAITVPPGQSVTHDLLEIGDDVVIEGDVVGDVVCVGGDVVVRGRVTGDVVAMIGSVRVEPTARIDGDVATVLGRVDVAGEVTGDVRAALPTAPGHRATYLSILLRPEIVLLRLALLCFGTLLALAAAFALPGALVRASEGLRGRVAGMTLLGALFHLSAALTVVIFTALVVIFVGMPLLALLLVALTLFRGLALGAAFHHVGSRLLERRGARAASGYAAILLGALLVGAVSFIPIVGELAWIVVSCAGAGAVLATWRRHPQDHASR